MRGRALVAPLLLAVALLTNSCAKIFAAPAYQGMSYTSFGQNALASAGSDQSLLNMSIVGVDTVAINFWWFQDSITANSMAEDFTRYSSTISSVEHAIDTAHDLGMKVLLKPMLDVKDGTWRAMINPSNKDQWFANYTNFLGTFADIAQSKGVELFSIGCEMNTLEQPVNDSRWSNLITNMRSRYDGELTYAANWGAIDQNVGGYENVTWWNQLDYIGIDAYFPLSNRNNNTLGELTTAWQGIADDIEGWRATRGLAQPVLLTEIGYRSLDGAARAPWGDDLGGGVVDLQEQANAYNAALTVLTNRTWFDGAFWWSWETNPFAGGVNDNGFTPQGKPAQTVLQNFYGGDSPPPAPAGAPTQTLFSWETGLEGWQVPDFHSRPVALAQAAVGVTDGAHSLAVTQTGGGFSWDHFVVLGDDALAAFSLAANDLANYRLEFDVTYNKDFIPQGSVTYLNQSVSITNYSGAWSQVDGIATTSGRSNETIRVAIPLSSFSSLTPGSAGYRLFLALNGNWGSGSATVFFDNLRLVNLAAPLTGDFNGDGQVDAADYTVWRDTLGSSTNLAADANLNGLIDNGDYALWRQNFGATLSGGAASWEAYGEHQSVPEPAAAMLVLLSVGLWASFCNIPLAKTKMR